MRRSEVSKNSVLGKRLTAYSYGFISETRHPMRITDKAILESTEVLQQKLEQNARVYASFDVGAKKRIMPGAIYKHVKRKD